MIAEKEHQSERQNELRLEWQREYDYLIENVNRLKREDNHTSVLSRTLHILRLVLILSDIKEEDIYIDNLNEGSGLK